MQDNNHFVFDSFGHPIDKSTNESKAATKALRTGKFGAKNVTIPFDTTLPSSRQHVSKSNLQVVERPYEIQRLLNKAKNDDIICREHKRANCDQTDLKLHEGTRSPSAEHTNAPTPTIYDSKNLLNWTSDIVVNKKPEAIDDKCLNINKHLEPKFRVNLTLEEADGQVINKKGEGVDTSPTYRSAIAPSNQKF